MKKSVSLLLAVVLLLSVGIVSAFAEESAYMYKSAFETEYGEALYYREVCYYPEDLDEYYLEWILVKGAVTMAIVDPLPGTNITRCYENSGILFYEKDLFKPFNTSNCVYDVKHGEFIDITEVDFDKYPGLKEAVLMNDVGYLIGDMDSDKEVSIIDATEIQRIQAKVTSSRVDENIADFDRDGKRTILDATAIQLSLAKHT